MDAVKDAMEQVELTGSEFNHPFPYTFMYVQWEANKVPFTLHTKTFNWFSYFQIISNQLIRNLGFAFGVIAIVSIVLISDLFVSLLVFICVGT